MQLNNKRTNPYSKVEGAGEHLKHVVAVAGTVRKVKLV